MREVEIPSEPWSGSSGTGANDGGRRPPASDIREVAEDDGRQVKNDAGQGAGDQGSDVLQFGFRKACVQVVDGESYISFQCLFWIKV